MGNPAVAREAEPALAVSVYIICLNEADTIGRCLESCKDFAQIIVVDSGSTDGTLEIIEAHRRRGLPITLLHQDWLGFSAQKQFALEQCTSEWCLNLDGDEELTPALVGEIPRLIARTDTHGWRIARWESLYPRGLTHKRTRRSKILRLFRRRRGAYDLSLKVHERIVIDGPVGDAGNCFLHNAVVPFARQMEKDNAYATLKAEQKFAKGVRPSYGRLLLVAPLAFFKIYIVNRYFLNGLEGFNRAVLAGIYAYAKEAKLFELHRAPRNTKGLCV